MGVAYAKLDSEISDLFNFVEGEDYMKELNLLNQLIDNELVNNDSLLRNTLIPPVNLVRPEKWFLGAQAKNQAINHKGNLCLSLFHSPLKPVEYNRVFEKFIAEFYAKHAVKPITMLGIYFTCSTDTAFIKLEKMKHAEREKNKGIAIPSIIGEPSYCYEELAKLTGDINISELLLTNQIADLDRKYESVQLLSEFNQFSES